MALLALALLAPATLSTTGGSSAAEACPELRWLDGVGHVCEVQPGLYEVFAPDGRSLGFTHGTDPRCDACGGPALAAAGGSAQPHCVAGDPGENYVRVVYARAFDDADRYASMVGTIRSLVGSASATVDEAAIATGDRLAIRVRCTDGLVSVDQAVLPTGRGAATFSSIVNDLQGLGYTDPKQKFWIYYDDAGACACAGTGHIYPDDRDIADNRNNAAPDSVPMFAVSFDSPVMRTMLHELGHTLGAVQTSAPTSTAGLHCTDGLDTMCYNDGSARGSQYNTGHCAVEVFDCNKDTYCHANPPLGSYLDTHWQACHRFSRFLQFGDNVAPVMAALSCSPEPSFPDETVACSFRATDGNVGVYYTIDWGDGATTRAPASGMTSPGATTSATHAYTAQAERTVSVTATDSGTPPMTSAPMTLAHSVGPSNAAPIVATLSCVPAAPREADTVTCAFNATDVHNVSYVLSWGDGSAPVRVPASGVVAPDALQSRSHAYGRGGVFSVQVNATDDGRPPRLGPTRSLALQVDEVNTPPSMVALACPGGLERPGVDLVCTFSAADDSAGVRYHVEWGDGSASDVPASGYAAPGATQSAAHAFGADGEFQVNVTATDSFAPPATSAPARATIRTQADQTAPTLTLADPRAGFVYQGCAAPISKAAGRPLFLGRGCVRALATDLSGIARVEVLRNGATVATDVSAPYDLEWTIRAPEVDAAYTVRAVDTKGFVRSIDFRADGVPDPL